MHYNTVNGLEFVKYIYFVQNFNCTWVSWFKTKRDREGDREIERAS